MIFSFGSKKQKSSSKQQSSTFVDPSQQPFLQDVRRNAQSLYNQGGMPVEGVAGINPTLSNALYNQNMGGANISGYGNQMMSQGSALAGGSASALGFANRAMGGQVDMPQMRSQGPMSLSERIELARAQDPGGMMQHTGMFGGGSIVMGPNGRPQMQSQGPESLMGNYQEMEKPAFSNGRPQPRFQPAAGPIGTAFGAGNRYAGGVAGGGIAQGSGVNSGMANEMAGNAVNANAAVNQGADVGSAGRYGDQAMMGTAAQGQGPNLGMASQIGGMAGQSAGTQNQGFNPANLSKYMNNDVLQGQIDAASRDITRNLQQKTLPQIQGQAAGSGNSGSSRIGNMMGTAMGLAGEAIGDISGSIRGNAYSQGVGIEANREQQNAQMGQQNQQFNTGQSNSMLSQGINTATGVDAMNTGYRQQQGMANQNAFNQMTGQGFGIDAATASQNAGFGQQANMYNAQAGNALLGQGYGIGASQLESNLGRQQQGNQFDARSYNDARDFGSQIGANAFNNNMQNQQFGASLAATLGNQGINNMNTGAQMFGFGNNMQMAAGQYGRDYQQQLLNQRYRQGMSPYQNLEFYNSIIGAPNNLSQATASSKGSSSGFNIGFGKKE